MEDYKWIIYVVLGLIYFFAKSKKKPQQQDGPQRDTSPSAPVEKPISFEDLLREIQSAKSPKQPEPEPFRQVVQSKRVQPKQPEAIKPFYEPPQYGKYDEYDDYLKTPKPLEDADYDYRKKDNIYDVYEKAKTAAFQRPSLEETMNVEDTIVRFGQFKEYQRQEEPSLASIVAKDFQNLENIRKAFVMSEILKRKY